MVLGPFGVYGWDSYSQVYIHAASVLGPDQLGSTQNVAEVSEDCLKV